MTPRQPPSPARSSEFSQAALQQSVEELSQKVRLLTDVIGEVREELSWLARNGVPHQPLDLRMTAASSESAIVDAHPDLSADTGASMKELPLTGKMLDDACDWLADNQADLLQQLLDEILSAQDDLKRQVIAALTGTRSKSPQSKPTALLFPSEEPDAKSTTEIAPVPKSATTSLPPAATGTDCIPPHNSLPSITLFELGDGVEFTLDGRELWGEIVALDDAESTATVLLIPSEEAVTVSQDLLQPDRSGVKETPPLIPIPPENSSRPQSSSDSESEVILERQLATGPFTLRSYGQLRRRLSEGTITPDELRREFDWLRASRDSLVSSLTNRLNVSQLRSLSATLGCYQAGRCSKAHLARNCYDALLGAFMVKNDVRFVSGEETYEEAVARVVAQLSANDLRSLAGSSDPSLSGLDQYLEVVHPSGRH